MAETDGPAISLRGLVRRYGDRVALDGVDLDLPEGQTLAVLGPNGSGKSTLLRVLATLLRPSGGEASVLGARLPGEAWQVRGRVGYLGHQPLLYRDLTGRENLVLQARLNGLDQEGAAESIERDLELVGMSSRADEAVGGYSAGMRQRISICRAVLTRPPLLLLDEPDSNLDPDGRVAVRDLVGPASGRTRVLVSHEPERALAEADLFLRLGPSGKVEEVGTP